MKNLYLILFTIVSLQISFAQDEWHEHLSHDRIAYNHLGHFVVDGKIVLVMGNKEVPMNTLETIEGNYKKTQTEVSPAYTFRPKTTRTGIDDKKVILIESQSYDIPGKGAHSIRENSDEIKITSTDLEKVNQDYVQIIDAYMPGGPMDDKECVVYDKKHVLLNYLDEVQEVTELDEYFSFHEGLGGNLYKIENGIMTSFDPVITESLDLGDFDNLFNDPYKNQFIEVEEELLNRYSFDDFALVTMDELIDQPIDVQFVENGFYYLIQTDDHYQVYYYSDAELTSELFYELEKSEEVDEFWIRNIEVIGDEIYFLGWWRSTHIKERFSYVQRRSLNEAFTPNRKDLELSSVIASREQLGEHKYDYNITCEVKNLSSDTVNHFTIYSNNLNYDDGPRKYFKFDIQQEIAPGESFEVSETFQFFYEYNTLTFQIEGVDFGIDRDEANNSFTVDVVILSNKETDISQFTLAPNLSSDFISIKDGDINEIESIYISNINGHKIKIRKNSYDRIKISNLPQGKYWLEILTKSRLEKLPFMKI